MFASSNLFSFVTRLPWELTFKSEMDDLQKFVEKVLIEKGLGDEDLNLISEYIGRLLERCLGLD